VRILIVTECEPDYAATSSGFYLHASNQLTSINTPYLGFRTKVPLSPVQTTCSPHLTLFVEDYHYKAEHYALATCDAT